MCLPDDIRGSVTPPAGHVRGVASVMALAKVTGCGLRQGRSQAISSRLGVSPQRGQDPPGASASPHAWWITRIGSAGSAGRV
jgi:hypothetical protein